MYDGRRAASKAESPDGSEKAFPLCAGWQQPLMTIDPGTYLFCDTFMTASSLFVNRIARVKFGKVRGRYDRLSHWHSCGGPLGLCGNGHLPLLPGNFAPLIDILELFSQASRPDARKLSYRAGARRRHCVRSRSARSSEPDRPLPTISVINRASSKRPLPGRRLSRPDDRAGRSSADQRRTECPGRSG